MAHDPASATLAKPDPVKALVISVAADADYELANYWTDGDFELYFDILSSGTNIGCISRGWNYPGYRISEQIVVQIVVQDHAWREALRDFCATNGVAVTWTHEKDCTTISMESVLYDEGFNDHTLAKPLEALLDCRNEAQAVSGLLQQGIF